MDQSRTSQQGLTRSALRAALWLARLLHCMPDGLRLPKRVWAYAERRLDLLAGFIIHLVIIHAARHCRPGWTQRDRFAAMRAAARHDVRVSNLCSMRATVGGQLRRALKVRGRGAKHLKARAEAILHALRTLDHLTARFVRRMKQGLSRRMGVHTRVSATSPLHRPAVAGRSPSTSKLGEELRALAPP